MSGNLGKERSSENVEYVKMSELETKYGSGVDITAFSKENCHCYLLRFITKAVAPLHLTLKNTFRNQAGFSKFT